MHRLLEPSKIGAIFSLFINRFWSLSSDTISGWKRSSTTTLTCWKNSGWKCHPQILSTLRSPKFKMQFNLPATPLFRKWCRRERAQKNSWPRDRTEMLSSTAISTLKIWNRWSLSQPMRTWIHLLSRCARKSYVRGWETHQPVKLFRGQASDFITSRSIHSLILIPTGQKLLITRTTKLKGKRHVKIRMTRPKLTCLIFHQWERNYQSTSLIKTNTQMSTDSTSEIWGWIIYKTWITFCSLSLTTQCRCSLAK